MSPNASLDFPFSQAYSFRVPLEYNLLAHRNPEIRETLTLKFLKN